MPTADTTRKLATIVALDVAGYSARTEADEARTTAEVVALHTAIEAIAARHTGRVFNTAGDGFMLEFGSSLAAVEAAFELAETCEPRVRVGVHLGDVVVQPNGDLLGHGVNVAARLMAQAVPGTVLVSADVQRTIRGPLAQSLHSKGTIKLAKMAEAIEVFALVPDDTVHRNLGARLRNIWARRPAFLKRSPVLAGVAVLLTMALGWIILGRPNSRETDATAIPEASVAVLPFENLSPDKNNAFFASGIQDEILTRLAKIGSLKVISRTSTSHFASRPENLPEIAKQLGVANILEGSVQREGDAVRVNVQLIKASTDGHLWAEIYDRKLDNIFSVQSEIAIAIANALSAKVTGEEKKLITLKPTSNPEAYDIYLRGLTELQDGDVKKAEGFLRQAVSLDPSFIAAWALLTRTSSLLFFRVERTDAQRARSLVALQAALRLAPNAPETKLAQGFYKYYVYRDYDAARQAFESVNVTWPNNVESFEALALIARRQGRWQESTLLIQKAITLDPLRVDLRGFLVAVLFSMRDYEEVLHQIDASLKLDSDRIELIDFKVRTLQLLGRMEEAAIPLQRILKARPEENAGDSIYFQAKLTRNYNQAIATFTNQLNQTSDILQTAFLRTYLGELRRLSGNIVQANKDYVAARDIYLSEINRQPKNASFHNLAAWVYMGLGDRANAYKYIAKAIELLPTEADAADGPNFEDTRLRIWAHFGDRENALRAIKRLLTIPAGNLTPEILRLDPDFDKLRGDPRFQALAHSDEAPK